MPGYAGGVCPSSRACGRFIPDGGGSPVHVPRDRAGSPYCASSSETQPSRKRRNPLPSRLGLATQWPQGEA